MDVLPVSITEEHKVINIQMKMVNGDNDDG